MSKATFTKLKNGDWGVKIEGPVIPGGEVTVTKKDGNTTEVTVGEVVWSGNGYNICKIKKDSPSGQATYKGKKCYCSECGELDRPQKGGSRCKECYEGFVYWE